tara:strand:- start:761 stop:922 length:162 start_codon:yes stop_codon:yes gene_type:complete
MEYNDYRQSANMNTEMSAKTFLKKYSLAEGLKSVWTSKFEEAYEYYAWKRIFL